MPDSCSDLSLYQTEWCPFCVRVRGVIDRLGIDVELRDTSQNETHQRELVAATGRGMVPCLRIEAADGDAQWLHESAAIEAYLQKRFA